MKKSPPPVSEKNAQMRRDALTRFWKKRAFVLDDKILPLDFDFDRDSDCFEIK